MTARTTQNSVVPDQRFTQFAAPVQGLNALPEKIEALTRSLLGAPYAISPLGGSPDQSEQVRIALDTFDCVTLKETVLAAVHSHSSIEFVQRVIALRYADERVSWLDRNHYSVDWIANNESKGLVRNITPAEDIVSVTRTLSFLAGYPACERQLNFLPVDRFWEHMHEFQTGDLIYFGTTRENLDVSHVAFLVFVGDEPYLHHATKSKGAVVEEKLADFLVRFGETPGVMVVRPL